MEEIQAFLNENLWWTHVSAVILGMIRIMTFMGVCPIFGPSINMAVKGSIALALYIPLHPLMLETAGTIHLVTIGDNKRLFLDAAVAGIVEGEEVD